MATSFETPYTYTATGDLGSQRETMLQNELLLRNKLGKPKRRGYLYSDGFTFGRPNERRDNTAGDALRGWSASYTTLPFHQHEKKADRDFMALNRAAVSAGLVTAPEHYEFRATHDVRRRTSGEEKRRTGMRRIPPTMVFGISTRPSTPIFDLLEHKYQDRWQQQRRQQELAKKQEDTKKQKPGAVYSTRASLLKTYQNPVDPAPLWQMPKFTRNTVNKRRKQRLRRVMAATANTFSVQAPVLADDTAPHLSDATSPAPPPTVVLATSASTVTPPVYTSPAMTTAMSVASTITSSSLFSATQSSQTMGAPSMVHQAPFQQMYTYIFGLNIQGEIRWGLQCLD